MTHSSIIQENNLNSSSEFENKIISSLKEGKPLTGKDGILTPLISQAINKILEGEIENHLEVCQSKGEPNRRNGKLPKKVKTQEGNIEIETPRDRAGTFEPQIVKKRQTILPEALESKVLSLFSSGMSYSDIKLHISETYGVDLSSQFLNKITDKLLPVITEWRNRALEPVYAVVFLDAMFFKIRENGKVVSKAIYNLLGINQEGKKEILGFYIADSEGSHFWLGVLNDLKARGVQDILIACVDGLVGFPEAISASFPKTEVQLCIVHQIRHSVKYVASRDQKEFVGDLKKVYQADTKDLAEQFLIELDDKWGKKYPMVLKSWNNKWDNLSTFFKYSKEIRKIIYTTNPIEAMHRQVRKYTKSKGAFTSENALNKLIYSAYLNIEKKWNQPISNWALIISQLDIFFENRLNIKL